MITAYFNNIDSIISAKLKSATKSILVAVAWFTDDTLFEILCAQAAQGLYVELIISDHEFNHDSRLNYNKLNDLGGYFSYYYSNDNTLMHNKFCIIDLSITITGSYNWSYKAKSNRENITVTEDIDLAIQFAKQFYRLKLEDNFVEGIELSEKEVSNISVYLNRLLKLLTEHRHAELASELFILNNTAYIDEEVRLILRLISHNQWKDAILLIEKYLSLRNQITLYKDYELDSLLFHKEALEDKLDKLILLKEEIEVRVQRFNIQYNQKLGHLLIELYDLKEKLNTSFQHQAAEIHNAVNEAVNTRIKNTDPVIDQRIKQIYRKAAILCHPDKLSEEVREEGERIFKSLHEAYVCNDIDTVLRIYEELKQSRLISKVEIVGEKEKVKRIIGVIISRINDLETQIKRLKANPVFHIIEEVYDWDLFYQMEEEKLKLEIKDLANEAKRSKKRKSPIN